MAEDNTSESGREAKVSLGFDYDPSKLQSFINDLSTIKKKLEDSGAVEGVKETMQGATASGVSSGLSGLFSAGVAGAFGSKIMRFLKRVGRKGLLGGFASVLAALYVDVVAGTQAVMTSFKTTFEGVEALAEETAKRINKKFNLGFLETRSLLSSMVSEMRSKFSISTKEAMKASEDLIAVSKAISAGTNTPFEVILGQLKSITKGTNIGKLAEYLNMSEEDLKARIAGVQEFKSSRSTRPEQADFYYMFSLIKALKTRFPESLYRESITADIETVQKNISDVFDKLAVQMVPPIKKFTKLLADASTALTDFVSTIAGSIKVWVLSFFEIPQVKKFKGKFKDFFENTKNLGESLRKLGEEIGEKTYEGGQKLKKFFKKPGDQTSLNLPPPLSPGENQVNMSNQVTVNIEINGADKSPLEIGEATKTAFLEVFDNKINEVLVTQVGAFPKA